MSYRIVQIFKMLLYIFAYTSLWSKAKHMSKVIASMMPN